jgi:hypothetical protein
MPESELRKPEAERAPLPPPVFVVDPLDVLHITAALTPDGAAFVLQPPEAPPAPAGTESPQGPAAAAATAGAVAGPAATDLPPCTLSAAEVSRRVLAPQWPVSANGLPLVDESAARLRHPPALAVLSPFNAGLPGPCYQDMVNAWLAAGAGVVLASLWKVGGAVGRRRCCGAGVLPAACCLLPAACCLLPAACCLLPAACCLLPAACRRRCCCGMSTTVVALHSFPESPPVSVPWGAFPATSRVSLSCTGASGRARRWTTCPPRCSSRGFTWSWRGCRRRTAAACTAPRARGHCPPSVRT